jgi:hypothetical protein
MENSKRKNASIKEISKIISEIVTEPQPPDTAKIEKMVRMLINLLTMEVLQAINAGQTADKIEREKSRKINDEVLNWFVFKSHIIAGKDYKQYMAEKETIDKLIKEHLEKSKERILNE